LGKKEVLVQKLVCATWIMMTSNAIIVRDGDTELGRWWRPRKMWVRDVAWFVVMLTLDRGNVPVSTCKSFASLQPNTDTDPYNT
jgi:hypothetical protein